MSDNEATIRKGSDITLIHVGVPANEYAFINCMFLFVMFKPCCISLFGSCNSSYKYFYRCQRQYLLSESKKHIAKLTQKYSSSVKAFVKAFIIFSNRRLIFFVVSFLMTIRYGCMYLFRRCNYAITTLL